MIAMIENIGGCGVRERTSSELQFLILKAREAIQASARNACNANRAAQRVEEKICDCAFGGDTGAIPELMRCYKALTRTAAIWARRSQNLAIVIDHLLKHAGL